MGREGERSCAGLARVAPADRILPFLRCHASFCDRSGLFCCFMNLCVRVLSCMLSNFWGTIAPFLACLRSHYSPFLSRLCISKQYMSKKPGVE